MVLSLSLMLIFVVNDWRAIGILSLYPISHSDFLLLTIVCIMSGCQSGKNSLWCWRNRISDTQKKSDRTSIREGRSPRAVYVFSYFTPGNWQSSCQQKMKG